MNGEVAVGDPPIPSILRRQVAEIVHPQVLDPGSLAGTRCRCAAIASEIQVALSPQIEAHLASARPVNPQAYEAWLRDGVYLGRVNAPDLETALEYYELAREIDPDYAHRLSLSRVSLDNSAPTA